MAPEELTSQGQTTNIGRPPYDEDLPPDRRSTVCKEDQEQKATG